VPDLVALFVAVCWRPLVSAAVVTHLVTHRRRLSRLARRVGLRPRP
jgi:hypothetical protein